MRFGVISPSAEEFAAMDRAGRSSVSPGSGSPSQVVVPSRSVSTPALRTPTKLYRDHCLPCSADSSSTVPGRLPASLR